MTRLPGAADILTLGNCLAGSAAVLLATPVAATLTPDKRLRAMALLLVCATVLDVVDGAAARHWGSTPLGQPLDALADAISFGLAPPVAVATYVLSAPATPVERGLVMAGALAYVASALLRLADFLSATAPRAHFTGLPTTGAAILALDVAFLTHLPAVGAAGLTLLGLLMVSPLHFPLQRSGLVAGWSLVGWGWGLVGIVGLVEVRVPAALSLLAIAVVVPFAMARRPGVDASTVID
jgi:CDP-diacylglycerol--serine O-phosphatidyltransferase